MTHWQPSKVDLGKRCDPRYWSFVEFPAPGADVAVDARTMGLSHGGRKRATVDT